MVSHASRVQLLYRPEFFRPKNYCEGHSYIHVFMYLSAVHIYDFHVYSRLVLIMCVHFCSCVNSDPLVGVWTLKFQ